MQTGARSDRRRRGARAARTRQRAIAAGRCVWRRRRIRKIGAQREAERRVLQLERTPLLDEQSAQPFEQLTQRLVRLEYTCYTKITSVVFE